MATSGVTWLRRAFINRNFTLFMLGTAASGIGYWFLLVALGWLVLDLSDSTFMLGLASFAQMAPMFVLGLVGGVIADRFNRRSIMLTAQFVVVLANGLLATAASLNALTIPVILACSLVFGLANSVLWPTWSVFIKDLVGAENLRHAVALNSARFNLTRVIGPALAGIMLERLGPAWCLWVGLASSFGIVLTIVAMRLPAWQPPSSHPPVGAAIQEALFAVWQLPTIRRLLTVTAVMGTVALPFQTFLPALARDVLRGGPEVLGVLTASVGLGAIVGALGTGVPAAKARPGQTMTALAVGVVAGLALLALSTSLWSAMVALALLGLSSIGFLSIANANVQLGVPEHLVGRVMGLWVVLNAGTQPIGSLIQGSLAEQTSLGTTFIVAAVITALAVGWYVLAEASHARAARPSAH